MRENTMTGKKISENYNCTIYACYAGYVVQAVINNLAPLLFLTFQREFGISLERIGLLCMGTLPFVLENPYLGLVAAMALGAVGGGLIEVLISPIVEAAPCKKPDIVRHVLGLYRTDDLCGGVGTGNVPVGVHVRRGGAEPLKDDGRPSRSLPLCRVHGKRQGILRTIRREDGPAEIHGRQRCAVCVQLSPGGLYAESVTRLGGLRAVRTLRGDHVARYLQPCGETLPAGMTRMETPRSLCYTDCVTFFDL